MGASPSEGSCFGALGGPNILVPLISKGFGSYRRKGRRGPVWSRWRCRWGVGGEGGLSGGFGEAETGNSKRGSAFMFVGLVLNK